MSSVASPPLPSFARRFARFVFTLLLLAAIFAGGVAVGARWGDRLPPPIGRTPPAPPPPAPSDSPSGDSLLASVDGRLVDLSDQYAEAERAEREAEVALKLLRNQGRPADHAAVREQEQLRALRRDPESRTHRRTGRIRPPAGRTRRGDGGGTVAERDRPIGPVDSRSEVRDPSGTAPRSGPEAARVLRPVTVSTSHFF